MAEQARTNGSDEHNRPADFAALADRFERLRDCSSAERATAIEQLRAEQPTLATALVRLLAVHDQGQDWSKGPASLFGRRVVFDALSAAPSQPATIGPYRVLRELGQGGMGRVFLAEHQDPDLRRPVAIKVLRSAFAEPQLARRLRHERRILGSLQHPNIATLFDGGTTDDGQPFVVMELVDGTDLITHCANERLDVAARLRLFGKVCRAVDHAHRALVVHRDLKPGNVLVTSAGEPKLLDFGIAKLLADDGDDAATRTIGTMLTPEYASPEQLRGEVVTTATDVYALGLLLFELLTGERAQARGERTPVEHMRRVCEEPTVLPSFAVRSAGERAPLPDTASRLARRLAGDLDTIVAQALRKEPERRYGSAAALADDLERHLAGLPVVARPDTFSYRSSKFVRRHRWAVASTALVAGLLVAFTVVTARQNRVIGEQLGTIRSQAVQVTAERDAAVAQRAVAVRVVDFLASLFDMAAPDPERGAMVRARDLLDRGARRIDKELAGVPAQQVPLQLAMARAYMGLGLYRQAEPLAAAAEAVLREREPDTAQHREAQFVCGGASLQVAHRAEGFAMLAASVQPVRSGPAVPADLLARRQMARSTWLCDAGRFDEALAAIEAARAALGPGVAVAEDGGDLDSYESTVRRELGEFPRARELAQQALERATAMGERLGGREADLLRKLSRIERELGEVDAAHAAMQKALAIDRRWAGEEHPDVDEDLFELALLEKDRGDLRAAERLLLEVVARDTNRFGEQHPITALSRGQLAAVVGGLGRIEEAERMFREVLAVQQRFLAPEHPEIPTTLANLGSLLHRDGRAVLAVPLFREALALREKILPADHPAVLTARQQLAVAALDLGRIDEAEPQFRAILAERRRVRGDHMETAGSLLSLATCLSRRQANEEALPLFAESTEMFRRTLSPTHPTVAHPLLGTAVALLRLERPAEAVAPAREAAELRDQALGPEHKDALYARFVLVRCLAGAKHFDEARELGGTLLPTLQRLLPGHRMTTDCERLLAQLPK